MNVLLIGLSKTSFVFLVYIFTKFINVLVFLELVPGSGFAFIKLLMEPATHFVSDCFFFTNRHVCKRVV